MKKILKADILAPEHFKEIKYTGFHPSRVLNVIPVLIKDVFRLGSTKFYEDQIKWDVSVDPVAFYGAWRGKYPQDKRSVAWVKVKIQGNQSKKEKMGEVTIYISGILETDFSYKTSADRAAAWTYSVLYYRKQRQYYINKSRKKLDQLENEIRKYFELLEGG